MSYLGSWKIDDVLTFPAVTHDPTTNAATDADSVPPYRVYENETGTPILTGTMALLDSGNTDGFYSEAITLSAANGFEKGKCYTIHISATFGLVTGAQHHTFQIEAEVDANVVSDKTGYTASTVTDKTGYTASPTAGSIAAASFAANAIDAAALAADAATEIGTAVWATAARTLTALDEDNTTIDLDATIRAAAGLAAANLDTQLAAVLAAIAAIPTSSVPTANQNADALLDRAAGVETSITPRQALRVILAAAAGVSDRPTSGTRRYKSTAGTRDRITATVDSGDRSAVTLDTASE